MKSHELKLMNKDLWRWVFQCLNSDSVTSSAIFSASFNTLEMMFPTKKIGDPNGNLRRAAAAIYTLH